MLAYAKLRLTYFSHVGTNFLLLPVMGSLLLFLRWHWSTLFCLLGVANELRLCTRNGRLMSRKWAAG